MSRDWVVKGEGKANKVYSYEGQRKELKGYVLRLRKQHDKNSNLCGCISALEQQIWSATLAGEREHAYISKHLGPHLGQKYVHLGLAVSVADATVEDLGLPPSAISQTAILLPDHTIFFNAASDLFKPLGKAVCVEMKPKCGFVTASGAIHPSNRLKKHVPRYTLHQLLKHEQAKHRHAKLQHGQADQQHEQARHGHAKPGQADKLLKHEQVTHRQGKPQHWQADQQQGQADQQQEHAKPQQGQADHQQEHAKQQQGQADQQQGHGQAQHGHAGQQHMHSKQQHEQAKQQQGQANGQQGQAEQHQSQAAAAINQIGQADGQQGQAQQHLPRAAAAMEGANADEQRHRVAARHPSISSYDPQDFFSADRKRVRKALGALIEHPHNNFRVFVDGKLVYPDERLEAAAKQQLEGQPVITREQGLEGTLREALGEQEDRVGLMVRLVSDALCSEGLLQNLLKVQQMDVHDIEGVYCIYHQLLCESCVAELPPPPFGGSGRRLLNTTAQPARTIEEGHHGYQPAPHTNEQSHHGLSPITAASQATHHASLAQDTQISHAAQGITHAPTQVTHAPIQATRAPSHHDPAQPLQHGPRSQAPAPPLVAAARVSTCSSPFASHLSACPTIPPGLVPADLAPPPSSWGDTATITTCQKRQKLEDGFASLHHLDLGMSCGSTLSSTTHVSLTGLVGMDSQEGTGPGPSGNPCAGCLRASSIHADVNGIWIAESAELSTPQESAVEQHTMGHADAPGAAAGPVAPTDAASQATELSTFAGKGAGPSSCAGQGAGPSNSAVKGVGPSTFAHRGAGPSNSAVPRAGPSTPDAGNGAAPSISAVEMAGPSTSGGKGAGPSPHLPESPSQPGATGGGAPAGHQGAGGESLVAWRQHVQELISRDDESILAILRDYLTAATAKDCGIMVTLQQVEPSQQLRDIMQSCADDKLVPEALILHMMRQQQQPTPAPTHPIDNLQLSGQSMSDRTQQATTPAAPHLNKPPRPLGTVPSSTQPVSAPAVPSPHTHTHHRHSSVPGSMQPTLAVSRSADTAPVSAQSGPVSTLEDLLQCSTAPVSAQSAPVSNLNGLLQHGTAPVSAQSAPVSTLEDLLQRSTAPVSAQSAPVSNLKDLPQRSTVPVSAQSAPPLSLDDLPRLLPRLPPPPAISFLRAGDAVFMVKLAYVDLDLKPLRKLREHYELDCSILALAHNHPYLNQQPGALAQDHPYLKQQPGCSQ